MSAKYHNPKSHAPAIFIPNWLSPKQIKDISLLAKITYGRLCQWSNGEGYVHRSTSQLAKEIGVCERSLERALKELRDLKLIETFQTKSGGVNHFRFLDHPWMHEPIIDELCYKNDTYTPPHQETPPPDRLVGTPPTDHADLNKILNKKLLNNKTNNNNIIYTVNDKNLTTQPVIVKPPIFSEKEIIKTNIKSKVSKRKIDVPEEIIDQFVFYVLKKPESHWDRYENVALKKYKLGEWKIPHGYNGLTKEQSESIETKWKDEKQDEIKQNSELYKSIIGGDHQKPREYTTPEHNVEYSEYKSRLKGDIELGLVPKETYIPTYNDWQEKIQVI